MNTNTQPLLEWRAPARINHEKSDRWYLVSGIICAIFVVYGILTGAWTMSITFGMIAGLYFYVRNLDHPLHYIRIFEGGIEFDGLYYIWPDFKHFWILDGKTYHELHVEPIKGLRADIVILTDQIDPFELRDVLNQFIPQIAHKRERLLDAIIRFCKL
ncbi:hypothetical protein A3C52_04955 [Candidatus Peribacteria bacterium RIFCSPHIGHO2_02_FULL_51_15]|nr:MAG: hypothetical protein A3C52_04955 [Candidatus Peribacteria bacterium RIFCSPHIGHO2_02_FULL_51_15]